MFGIILSLVFGIVIFIILWHFVKNVTKLVINSVLGLVLLLLFNLINIYSIFGKSGLEITYMSVVVCALAGLPGAILLMLLHVAGLV